MRLVEQHVIRASNPQFEAIDAAAFAAKNLYNAANFLLRQSFFSGAGYLDYYDLHALM
jgi:putative transposase